MKLRFAENYNLFVIFLILNLSGYNDENNKNGMHSLRIKIRNDFLRNKIEYKNLINATTKVLSTVHYSQVVQIFLLRREEIRFLKKNYYRAFPKHLKQVEKILPLIDEFEIKTGLKKYYKNHYLPYLNKLINNKVKNRLKLIQKNISDFVNIKSDWSISASVNLLEAYWRGHCYFLSKNKAIVVTGPDSKDFDWYINWHNIVHETIHIVLRKYLLGIKKKDVWNKIERVVRKNTLDASYRNNPTMNQLDETIVRAFTPLIMGEKLWDYTIKKFPLTELIYKELKEGLQKGKIKFDSRMLNRIIMEIIK